MWKVFLGYGNEIFFFFPVDMEIQLLVIFVQVWGRQRNSRTLDEGCTY